MTNHEDKTLTGIILDIQYWAEDADLYVHWSNGETYWCISDAVKVL